ncbi:MAG: imidazole glycerol phosphate synthase subunit HisH [Candidatus Thermoplasmatota archaeon]
MNVAIVDYGVGNLHSLNKALIACGATPRIVTDPAELSTAARIVLPGVGAFGAAASRLEPFRPALEAARRRRVPILGICLGMQLLFESSEESPGARGLGWLQGNVWTLRHATVPAMGWNNIETTRSDALSEANEHYYFVHSFVAPDSRATAATASHGVPYPAEVAEGSVRGVQFHPEKSGAAGLRLLARWLA